MDHKKHLLSYTRRAVDDYRMIRPGDKIAIGVSAGKDSLALLCGFGGIVERPPTELGTQRTGILFFSDVENDLGNLRGDDLIGNVQRLAQAADVAVRILGHGFAAVGFNVRKAHVHRDGDELKG